jgi:hypothetical protein
VENHLIIGLGGTGGKVLKAFRKRLLSEFSDEERTKFPVGFVYMDSTNEMMNPDDVTFRVLGKNASFTNSEFVNVKGVELNTVFKNPSGFPGLKGFIGDPEVMQKTIGSIGEAAGQKRKAGRILFGGSVQTYLSTVQSQYKKVKDLSGNAAVNIHIFTGLAGGTGSGAIIDVIAQTRKMFPEKMNSNHTLGANILVYVMIPEVYPPEGCEAGRYHANGFAALTEINAQIVGKYLPHDVTGLSDRIENSGPNGVFIYTNVNEHGKVVHSFEQLPVIVSDLIYSYVFLEGNNNTQQFMRSYNFENIDDAKNEYNEKVPEGHIDKVRSKSFGSFGIKRVIIPEEEIIEFFTYNFGRQALLQIRYNNWNDDLGFQDKPANVDFSTYVKEAENLERWHITDKHLTLDKPILNSDKKKFGTVADYWNNVVPEWTKQAATQKLPLNELKKYCNDGYEKMFRKLGVAEFYAGKTQVKEEHAKEIENLIEIDLFDKWGNGDLSLFNLTQLIDKLTSAITDKRKEFENKIAIWNQSIEQLTNDCSLQEQEYANTGLIHGDIFGKKKKIIQAHSTYITQLYVKKTELAGINFGIALLQTLKIRLEALRNRTEKFVNTVSDAIADTDIQIGSRCNDSDTMDDIQEAVIRFYNQEAVVKFTKQIILNKRRQDGIASGFRTELLKFIGNERTFANANSVISNSKITQILDTFIREKSISIHDEVLTESYEKLVKRNILEQLNEEYKDPDELNKFAKDLIEKSGVYLTFNQNEINRAVKNNSIPNSGVNIYKKVILINLPKIEGNEQVQQFAERFKQSLRNAVSGNVIVQIDANGKRENEITVISLTYCFPLRAIQDLALLKEKYDYLVNNPNEAYQNRAILHTEGDGTNFPNLFVEDDMLPSQIREKYLQYLIINYAAGNIKYADKQDGTGKCAYGTIVIDELGDEVLNPVADKFIEIPFSEKFTEQFGEELKVKAENALKNDYLHVEKRKELVSKIQKLYGDVIVAEFSGNKGKPECIFFADQAKKAINTINNF